MLQSGQVNHWPSQFGFDILCLDVTVLLQIQLDGVDQSHILPLWNTAVATNHSCVNPIGIGCASWFGPIPAGESRLAFTVSYFVDGALVVPPLEIEAEAFSMKHSNNR